MSVESQAAPEQVCEHSFAVPDPFKPKGRGTTTSRGDIAMLELRASSDSGVLGRSGVIFIVVSAIRRDQFGSIVILAGATQVISRDDRPETARVKCRARASTGVRPQDIPPPLKRLFDSLVLSVAFDGGRDNGLLEDRGVPPRSLHHPSRENAASYSTSNTRNVDWGMRVRFN